MKTNEELELIDIERILEDFFKTIKKFWIQMLIVITVITAGFFVYSFIGYSPVYESNATFSVSTSDSSIIGTGNSSVSQVKESLPYILQTDLMKNMVKEDLGLESFPAYVSLESKESANFFVLKVTSADAEMSYQILQSIIEHCPQASVYVLGRIQLDVLDDSGVPGHPVNHLNKKISLIKGGLIGVMLCLAVALLYAVTRRTIQREEDFKKYLSVSCIASVPKITFKKRRKKIDKHIHIYNEKVGYAFLESVRTIRARVMKSAEEINAKVIMVTSSIPGEGKSTIASNLALSLGEKGLNVVLVDLDLRNPSVGKVLGLEDKITSKRIYKKEWKISIMMGDDPKSDPTSVLGTNSVKNLIEDLRNKFDYVILDTPPAAMLADASAIAECADCAVYVVKQDYVRIERIAEGMDALTLAETPILGVILNGVERVFGTYGNYSRYGKYGYEEKK